MTESGKVTFNSLVFTDSSGSKNISINVTDNIIDFGALELRGGSFVTSGPAGTIDTFSIEVAGSGFSVDDTGSISAKTGNGTGGSFSIVAVNGSGGITDMDVTNGGDGYRVGDMVFVGNAEIKVTGLD